MDLQLKGKCALVTGSTAGIGFAAARLLAAEGARVVINGRQQDRVDSAARSIREMISGADVRGIPADLATAQGCSELTAQLPEVDVLVNNVGVFEPKAFEEITDRDWMRFFETNVLSGVRLSRHYL
ncbi:MAG: SDR family NAD(P)-dependent oxidoreductase, partial [Burkholderiales bacterium]